MTGVASDPSTPHRQAAARRAVQCVRDGMVIGFGTGRAATAALEALAERAAQGLRICGVPSSAVTERRARALGLPITTLEDQPQLDVTIDGADEVDPALNLLKGGGGALLREKVLAAAARRLVIVVEEAKLVPHLCATRGVPLEVLPFAWRACALHLERLGGTPTLRRGDDGNPLWSDNGNYLLDCAFGPAAVADPSTLDRQMRSIPGVLETGVFWSFSPAVVIGSAAGVRLLGQPLES